MRERERLLAFSFIYYDYVIFRKRKLSNVIELPLRLILVILSLGTCLDRCPFSSLSLSLSLFHIKPILPSPPFPPLGL